MFNLFLDLSNPCPVPLSALLFSSAPSSPISSCALCPLPAPMPRYALQVSPLWTGREKTSPSLQPLDHFCLEESFVPLPFFYMPIVHFAEHPFVDLVKLAEDHLLVVQVADIVNICLVDLKLVTHPPDCYLSSGQIFCS